MMVLTTSYSKSDAKKNKKLNSQWFKTRYKKSKNYGIKFAVIYDEKLYNSKQFDLNMEFINKYKNYHDTSEINKNIR